MRQTDGVRQTEGGEGWRETQRALAEAVREFRREPDAAVLAAIVPGGTLTREGALQVYRAGYTARLTEALGETYEAVWWALGDEDFFAVCADYIAAYPSRSYNLSDYGAEFPAFAAAHERAAGLGFLEELASFEWRFKQLFHTAEHEPMEAGAAAATLRGCSDARITLGRACVLFAAQHAIYEVWKLRKADPEACTLPDLGRAQFLLAYKSQGQTYVKELTEAEFRTLARLRSGMRLGPALAEIGAAHPDFDGDAVAGFFHTLFEAGLVTAIEPG